MLLKNYQIAYLDLTLSMTFLGSTLVIGKSLISIFPIFLLLSIRFLIGTICFSLSFYKETNKANIFNNSLIKKDWLLLFLQSLFGAFLFNLFMLLGLRHTSAGNAAIITSTIPAFITIFSFFILKEKISKNKLIAIIFAIFGLLLATLNIDYISLNKTVILGNILIILAVVSGSLFPICIKLTSKRVSKQLISLSFNLGGLLLFIPLSLNSASQFNFSLVSTNIWFLVIFYSLAANVLYLHFWNKGLAAVSASTASLFTAIMPISAAILAYLFLSETLTYSQITGIIFVILAIIVGVYKK